MKIEPDAEAAVKILSPGYRALFARAAQRLADEPAVRALWISGSLARGDADAFSDLDLLAAVADDEFDAFAGSWKKWLADVTPTVIARPIPFLPGSFYSLTPDCERLDVVLERVSKLPTSFFCTRTVVFDRDGLDAQVPKPPPPAAPDRARVETAIEEPLRYLSLFPAMLGRGELMLGQEGFGHMRRRLSELFLELNAPLPTTGVKHWRDKLTAEQYAVLEALPWPAATREALIDANRAFARVFFAHGRRIAEMLGVRWPEELEAAVRAHLVRELGLELDP